MKRLLLVVPFIGLLLTFGFRLIDRQENTQESNLQQSVENGKKVYESNCLSCHQANGSGVYNIAPPLRGTSYVLGDKTTLISIVLKGFNEDVEIEGEYYSNPMPAFPQLNDQEIADVLTYVRNNFENKTTAITPEEVRKERDKFMTE